MGSMPEMGLAGEAEGARRATGASPAVAPAGVPDPAVEAKPKRRLSSGCQRVNSPAPSEVASCYAQSSAFC